MLKTPKILVLSGRKCGSKRSWNNLRCKIYEHLNEIVLPYCYYIFQRKNATDEKKLTPLLLQMATAGTCRLIH